MAHDFGSPGTASTEVPLQRPASMVTTLPHESRGPWVYRAHPLRWMLVDGEWLPDLGRIFLHPGQSGVDKTGSDTYARVDAQKKGWTILPWELTPDGQPYLKAHRCRDGVYHANRWEAPRALGGKARSSQWDLAGYYDWLRWLLREGHIEAPDPSVIEAHIAQQRQHVEKLARESHKPEMAHVIDAAKARLAEMERAAVGGSKPARKGKAKAAESDA